MARKPKKGLTYFPMDIDIFQDIKIRKLIKYQGGKAISVYAYLLCSIYKDGYYMRWDHELPFIVSEVTGYEEAYIHEVIKSCLNIGLFSKNLFDTEKILTSKGIQERFVLVMKNLNRVSEIDEFNLISSEETPVSSQETPISKPETPISSEFGTQRKEKERKENKRKGNEQNDGGEPPAPSPLKNHFDFDSIVEHYHQKCPGMPRVTLLNESRKNAIKARLKEVGPEGVMKMIQNAGSSEFLNGKNERLWIANFDWLFKPTNFAKVLEGNFLNYKSNANFKANDPRASAAEGYDEPI